MSVLISTRGNIFRNDGCFSICLGSIEEPPRVLAAAAASSSR